MTKKDEAKLARLRARSERLLERGQAVEREAHQLYEAASEADYELLLLERKLGISKSLPVSATSATSAMATSIYKKLYPANVVLHSAAPHPALPDAAVPAKARP